MAWEIPASRARQCTQPRSRNQRSTSTACRNAHPNPAATAAYAADTGSHDALLDAFLDAHDDWQKWRTWPDEATHAIHESQTLRIERIHEAHARETAWTVAAYETPVSDRLWVLTATGATPAHVLRELLQHLADEYDQVVDVGAPVDNTTIIAATMPLAVAGWKPSADGRWIRWVSPTGDTGMQFGPVVAQHPTHNLVAWTIWGGPSPDRPAWTLTASPHTPSSLLADLAESLTPGIRTGRPHTACPEHRASHGPVPPATPKTPASHTR